MADKWEVSPEYPEGRWVPLTPEEEAERARQAAAGDAADAAKAVLDANQRTIDQSLRDRLALLRTSLDAVTANPPTLFPSLSAAERRVIRDLLRSTIELTRMTLRMLEATD